MKFPASSRLPALALGLLLGACETGPARRPPVAYPASFPVAVGGAAIPGYGTPDSAVTAVHPLEVRPNRPVYYQVLAPSPVTVFVYQAAEKAGHTLLERKQGRIVTGSVTPTGARLEFAFGGASAGGGVEVQVTVSDEAIPGPPPPPPALRVD